MKKVVFVLFLMTSLSLEMNSQGSGFDKYKWKSRDETYSFSTILKQTEDNIEAHKIMHKAVTFNKVAKYTTFIGLSVTTIALALDEIIPEEKPKIDPNDLSTLFPSTEFSDVAPTVFGLGFALTGFIWRGIAVSKLKKAVMLSEENPKFGLLISPKKVGFVLTF